MRRRFCWALLLSGSLPACSASQTPGERLIGSWVYVSADGNSGEGITVRTDGTYALIVLQTTSATSANV